MAEFDIKAAIAQAATKGPDMTQAQTGGGGGYTPPAAGVCLATLIGYIEIGKQKKTYNKQEKVVEQVQLIFELAGGKNAPRELEDGTKLPHRITVTETLSLNEKANFFKLFKKLNYNGEAKHMCQLLGKHWLVNIIHTDNGKDGAERRVYANVRNEDGYTFRPPVRIVGDELAGDAKEIPIPAPEVLSELRLFLWDFPTKPMWDSLYIPGEYEERKDEKTGKVTAPAKSKNVIQEKIKSALNWVGSPMYELLQEGDGLELGELGETEVDTGTAAPGAGAAAGDDPLAGI